MDRARVSDVVVHSGQEILIELDEAIKTALSDVKRAQRWQEIVSNEEAEEDEVVNDALNVESELELPIQLLILQHHVLTEEGDVDQLEVVGVREFDTLDTSAFVALDHVLLPDDREVGLVRQQTQHDQICVCSVEAMSCVGVVVRVVASLTYVVKHFMLTFTWDGSVGEDARDEVLVQGVCIELILDEEVELLAEVCHELGAWGDGVAVEEFRHLLAPRLDLRLEKGAFTGTFESSSSLLIHFGARSHTVDCQKNVFLRLHEMDDFVDGLHDGGPELLHVL